MVYGDKEFKKFEGIQEISIQNLETCAELGLTPGLRVTGLGRLAPGLRLAGPKLAPRLGLARPGLLPRLGLVGLRLALGVEFMPRVARRTGTCVKTGTHSEVR